MSGNVALGLVYCVVAGVGFGTNFLPVKKIEAGDGIFFSFCMSIGIMIVGLVASFAAQTDESDAFKDLPTFQPYAVLGGATWMIGNLMCPLIIKWIGLGLGLTVWDLTNMIMGWATGYFGLFHVKREEVKNPGLNLVGVSLAVLSLFLFTQARDAADEESQSSTKEDSADRTDPELARDSLDEQASNFTKEQAADRKDLELAAESKSHSDSKSTIDTSSHSTEISPPRRTNTLKSLYASISKRLDRQASLRLNLEVPRQFRWMFGFVLAMIAGLFMGYTFDPALELAQRAGNSKDQMDYVWSNFVGVLLTGNLVFVCYVLLRGEKSYTPRSAVLPAITSGAIWAVAQVAWFKANQLLSMSIAFPIIASLPGIVALAIGVLCFGELQTQRARFFALAGVGVRLPGILLIELSNIV